LIFSIAVAWQTEMDRDLEVVFLLFEINVLLFLLMNRHILSQVPLKLTLNDPIQVKLIPIE
jgi:hypothetical protein